MKLKDADVELEIPGIELKDSILRIKDAGKGLKSAVVEIKIPGMELKIPDLRVTFTIEKHLR
jgi:hypothetical protein